MCWWGRYATGTHSDVDGHSFPYIDGWCLAGMREDLLRLGGFDESLQEPAYYSDNLLCLEARAAGMTLRDVRPGLDHLENVTAGDQFTADGASSSDDQPGRSTRPAPENSSGESTARKESLCPSSSAPTGRCA